MAFAFPPSTLNVLGANVTAADNLCRTPALWARENGTRMAKSDFSEFFLDFRGGLKNVSSVQFL